MAALKHRRTALERVEKFLSETYFTDCNLRGRWAAGTALPRLPGPSPGGWRQAGLAAPRPGLRQRPAGPVPGGVALLAASWPSPNAGSTETAVRWRRSPASRPRGASPTKRLSGGNSERPKWEIPSAPREYGLGGATAAREPEPASRSYQGVRILTTCQWQRQVHEMIIHFPLGPYSAFAMEAWRQGGFLWEKVCGGLRLLPALLQVGDVLV